MNSFLEWTTNHHRKKVDKIYDKYSTIKGDYSNFLTKYKDFIYDIGSTEK